VSEETPKKGHVGMELKKRGDGESLEKKRVLEKKSRVKSKKQRRDKMWFMVATGAKGS